MSRRRGGVGCVVCVDEFHEEVVLRAHVKGEIQKSGTSPTPPQKKRCCRVESTAVKSPKQQVPRLPQQGWKTVFPPPFKQKQHTLG